MLSWLVQSSDVLGLHPQNWMLLIAGLFALYIGWLAFVRRAV
jgi:hypothetical protein